MAPPWAGATMKDRRRDVRLIEENKVVVSLIGGEVRPGAPTVYYSLTRDISMGGMRVMTGAPLETGARVRVDLTLGRSRKRIRTVAEVRWVRAIYADEVFEAGLQFEMLEPDAEFALMDHIFGGKNGPSL
jgi:c-di-GMP-binding flagellar brake protein YcgR